MTEIRVPTLGESVTEATIGKWFKQPGDVVAADEPLVELETEKVTIARPGGGRLIGDRRQGWRDRCHRCAAGTNRPGRRRAGGRRQSRRAREGNVSPEGRSHTGAPSSQGGRSRNTARPLGAPPRCGIRYSSRISAGDGPGRPGHQRGYVGRHRARRGGADRDCTAGRCRPSSGPLARRRCGA